ncbi:MAG TPA: hypothetical protein VI876_08790 [Dehalococcoidia bacterium]|nr:hypothetical protein [Dehalococcoidia bacterium]
MTSEEKLIPCARDVPVREQLAWLRAKDNPSTVASEYQRPKAALVPSRENATAHRVPQDKGKVPNEALNTSFRPPLISKRDQFAVGVVATRGTQCRHQIRLVVQAAVQDEGVEVPLLASISTRVTIILASRVPDSLTQSNARANPHGLLTSAMFYGGKQQL